QQADYEDDGGRGCGGDPVDVRVEEGQERHQRLEDEVRGQVSEAVADLFGDRQPVRARVLGHAHDDARFRMGVLFDDAGTISSAPASPWGTAALGRPSGWKDRMFPPLAALPEKNHDPSGAPCGAGGVVGSKSTGGKVDQKVPRMPIRNVRPGW